MKINAQYYKWTMLIGIMLLAHTYSLNAQTRFGKLTFERFDKLRFDKLTFRDTLTFRENGELDIRPSATSSVNDFDYLVGKWRLADSKLKSRLTNSNDWISFESTVEMKKLLNGIGNMDIYRTTLDGKPFEGVALRLFDPKTRLWSIYWADSNTGKLDPPVVGSFDGPIGKFYCKDTYKGKDIIVLFLWDKTNPDQPVWAQAFSPDNGVTWEWNATNTSYRVE